MNKILKNILILATTFLILGVFYMFFSHQNSVENDNVYIDKAFKVLFKDGKGIYLSSKDEEKSITFVNRLDEDIEIDIYFEKESEFYKNDPKKLIDFTQIEYKVEDSEYKVVSAKNLYKAKVFVVKLRPKEVLSYDIKIKNKELEDKDDTYIKLMFESNIAKK